MYSIESHQFDDLACGLRPRVPNFVAPHIQW